MRKLFLLLAFMVSISSLGQNTDPILSAESSVGRGFWNKGSQQVDGDFVLPSSLNNFTNPDLRDYGKLRYDAPSKRLRYTTDTEWRQIADIGDIIPQSNLVNYDAAVNTSEILNDGFFNGFPQIWQFIDNDILIHYSKSASHVDYATSRRVGKISKDGGKTFGSEFIINPIITNYAVNNVTTMVTKTNRFISMVSPMTSTGVNDGFLHIKYSDDKCQTFSNEILVPYPTGMVVCAGYGKGVNIADGKIMLGFYGYTGAGGTGDYRNYIITSSDNGVTWSNPVQVISTNSATAKYTEATYGYCSGSTIIGIIRNDIDNNNFVQVRSNDNGATWSTVGVVGFGTISSHSPEIAPYYDVDGNLYMSLWYVNRNPSRGLRSIVAKVDDLLNNGVSAWRADKLYSFGTHSFPSGDFGYPSVINPRRKNRFLIVSYLAESVGASAAYLRFHNYTWNATTATPTDVSNLLTTTITDGDITHAPNGNVVFDTFATKANLAGGNTFTSGNNIFDGDVLMPGARKLSVGAGTPLASTIVQMYNPTSASISYPLVLSSERGGMVIAGSTTNTANTDPMLQVVKSATPLSPGSPTFLYTQYGNGNTIFGGNTDAGFKVDVVGSFRAASGKVTAVPSANDDIVRKLELDTKFTTPTGLGSDYLRGNGTVANLNGAVIGLLVNTTSNSVSLVTAATTIGNAFIQLQNQISLMDSGYVSKTASYTLTSTDGVVDFTSGSNTATLPNAATIGVGKKYTIKNSGTGITTISTTSSQTIDGVIGSMSLFNRYSVAEIISDGTNWKLVGTYNNSNALNTTMTTTQNAASLNAAYPNAWPPFVVYAPNVGTGMVYIKTTNGGQWLAYSGTTLNP